ncbi:MAG: hypothetical protein HEP71_23345 [Roseivirga sp.]|nr:hypothetical protein [Roseivirga sp.]
MLKRTAFLLIFILLQTGLMAQYGFTREQLEQRKKHSRVNLHTEMELTGTIRQLLYEFAYEYLNGFILETEDGKAFKVESYYFVGHNLKPYLKTGEEVKVVVRGDDDLLKKMLYKSEEDKKAERSLNLKLTGLAHLRTITSSQGTFDVPTFDRSGILNVPRFEVIVNANIRAYNRGKRNSIQLILNNGDSINTYETDIAKAHYLDGKVSYVRPLKLFPGAHYRTSRTFHMVSPYSRTKILPSARDLKLKTVGQRSTFLDRDEGMSFVSLSKSAKGMVVVANLRDENGEESRMSFAVNNERRFNEFLEEQGKENLTLFYRSLEKPRVNYLYAIQKGGKRVILNESNDLNDIEESQKQKEEPYNLDRPIEQPESTIPNPVKGTLLRFLATPGGLYAGFLLVNESLDTLTFRLWNTHGKKVLNNFREGEEVEVGYEYISTRQIINEQFDNRQVDMTTFFNPKGRSSMNFYVHYPWLSPLKGDPNYDLKKKQFKKRPYYATKLSKGNLSLNIKPDYTSPEKEYTPTEIKLDVKILGIDKKKRDTRFYMENGDTLYMNTANGLKKGKRVSYTRIHPIVANGQAYDDPEYQDRVLQTVWVDKRRIGALTPIYDDWMRLYGYEGKIAGKKGLIRLATDMGKEVNEYISLNRNKDLTLLCNQFDISKRMPTFYFFVGLTNPQGELVFDDHVREPQHYEVDTLFTSKVKEIVKHSDLYTYRNTTIVLENGFVFSVNNDTFRSIEANALVGASLTLKGKPFIPRQGEVLKDKDYKLIKPSFLKAGNVEFKISE